jgi:hypothetical protein
MRMIRTVAFTASLALAIAACATGPGRPADSSDYFDPELQTRGFSCGDSPVVFAALATFEVEWFGAHLAAANEPSLYLASRAPDPAGGSYRFTWLRSFHAPVIVRIDEAPDGALRMTAKRLSGKGGYAPGRIAARVERNLEADEAASLRRLLAQGDLAREPPVGCEVGIDGAQWIVETSVGGSYRFVNRWGGAAPAVRDFGLLLLGFTGWDNEPLY